MKAELENMAETNANLRAQNVQIASQVEVNHASAKRIAEETENLKVSRLKEKATAPVYDMAGNVVKAGVSTAKEIMQGVNPFDKFGRSIGKKIFEYLHPEAR